jgi:hypothetical protein
MQNKPVAIIALPTGTLCKELGPHPYIEKSISLPNGQLGSYRIYADATEAAKWVRAESMKNMQSKKAGAQMPPASVPPTSSPSKSSPCASQDIKKKLLQQKQTDPSTSRKTFLETLVNQPLEQLRALNLKDITTEELEHGLKLVKKIKEGASAAQGYITKSMAHTYEHILAGELRTRESHSSKEAHNIARCGP